LHTYLSAKTPFGQRTMFQGIDVLPPAATAVVTREEGREGWTRPRPVTSGSLRPVPPYSRFATGEKEMTGNHPVSRGLSRSAQLPCV
ncbi:hypothetical protein, partial [Streptomyces sp. wa22]|uniref:hypothetical protein n=1 Tax=Streptomyces sp. wa22 TaxID=1828244 RepID=UPI0011CCCDFE